MEQAIVKRISRQGHWLFSLLLSKSNHNVPISRLPFPLPHSSVPFHYDLITDIMCPIAGPGEEWLSPLWDQVASGLHWEVASTGHH